MQKLKTIVESKIFGKNNNTKNAVKRYWDWKKKLSYTVSCDATVVTCRYYSLIEKERLNQRSNDVTVDLFRVSTRDILYIFCPSVLIKRVLFDRWTFAINEVASTGVVVLGGDCTAISMTSLSYRAGVMAIAKTTNYRY